MIFPHWQTCLCWVSGDVAQLGEHHNGIVGVVGSIPIISTDPIYECQQGEEKS